MTKTIRTIKIIVPKGAIKSMSKQFKCNELTVRRALSYTSDSELSVLIRREAINNRLGVETKIIQLRH